MIAVLNCIGMYYDVVVVAVKDILFLDTHDVGPDFPTSEANDRESSL
jgi:hypothetical protein